MFDAPSTSNAGEANLADLEGHLLVVEPIEHKTGITTTFGVKDAISVDVHDITAGVSHADLLWFPGVLVGSLKNSIGRKVLGVLGRGTAKAGQSPPWVLIDASDEPGAVKAATDYMTGKVSESLGAPTPAVQQMAEESGNPLLAAALDKLGAK